MSNRKSKILQAAYELFRDLGYENTSTSAIAQNAGVSSGAPFVHYHSKDEILADCLRMAQQKSSKVMKELHNELLLLPANEPELFINICFDALAEIRLDALFLLRIRMSPKHYLSGQDSQSEPYTLPALLMLFFQHVPKNKVNGIQYILNAILNEFLIDGDKKQAKTATLSFIRMMNRNE